VNAFFSRPRRTSVLLFLLLVAGYNANGRESGSIDGQAAKYFARGMAVRGTWVLDRDVAAQPQLGERAAFAIGRDGHWRPAYGVVPGLIAAIPAFVVHTTGLVDMDAPLAANLLAKVTASLLTAAAVTLVFLALLRAVSTTVALVTALALGFGTNYWAAVSQTLSQQECVAFGLALTLWAWWRIDALSRTRLLVGAGGLALAGAARMQVAPLVAVFLLWMISRVGWRAAVAPTALVMTAAALEVGRNLTWFGSVIGATASTEALHPLLHGVEGPLATAPWLNAFGLLVSPCRGLLVYSPIVLVALAGMALSLRRRSKTPDLFWLATAIVVQFIMYACYAVWWGGHSFGPRYLLDVLIPLAPFGAIGAVWVGRRPVRKLAETMLLIWSVGVAGLGTFVYPNDRWNTAPRDVDRFHTRLWEWRDSQISRALRSPNSPQNFTLFDRASVRQGRQ